LAISEVCDLCVQKQKLGENLKKIEKGTSEDEGRDVDSVAAAREQPLNEHIQFSDDEGSADETINEDFISLSSSGGLKPVCIKDVARLVPGMDAARQFRQQQLFGGRIKREAMTQRLAGAEKKRARWSKVTTSR